jgi:hypothetical protein
VELKFLALDDEELKAIMYPNQAGPKPQTTKAAIDFECVISELGRKSMIRAPLNKAYAGTNRKFRAH